MVWREGTAKQKALFGLICAVFLTGVGVDIQDKFTRIGQPDVGWAIERFSIAPTRRDASEAGLRGGGRPLSVNGVAIPSTGILPRHPPGTRLELGDVNTVRIRRPTGEIREIEIQVRDWRWGDALFAEGATALIGFLLFAVGAGTFLLRPFEATSWALLSFASFAGGLLLVALVPLSEAVRINPTTIYFFAVLGCTPAVILHVALAFPVLHPSIATRPKRVLALVYSSQPVLAANYLGGWTSDFEGIFSQSRLSGATMMLAAVAFFVGRCLHLALWGEDRVVMQRARILLAGIIAGLAPVTLGYFLQESIGSAAIDDRFLYWPVILFIVALARVTLRHEFLNAAVAVRRAVIYASTVAILTGVAILLSTMKSYAVAILLFPLLYLWPRFDARLNARLYPKRSHFPDMLREIGRDLAAAESRQVVLQTLAAAPARMCDAIGALTFLLPNGERAAHFAAGSGEPSPALDDLAEEPVVQAMVTLRAPISRGAVAIEPQFTNIRSACLQCLDRLRAEHLLPIERDGRVIGGLAVGRRADGSAYETPELDALAMLVQHAVQALTRIEATERLRERELEFAELKRFFPPQIIDQVMARGGSAELRSQRKVVTVVFVDMRGFTSFSDSEEPEEVMATLAEYHAVIGARIAEFAGTLERFAGDGMMVFFNDPVEQPDHVRRATAMARAILRDVAGLRQSWQRRGYRIDVGVGMHTGFATCGFIGYEGRRDYGVIGNVTNLAARLSDAAAPGEILVSARIRSELDDDIAAEPIGELELKGIHQPQSVFRLLSD